MTSSVTSRIRCHAQHRRGLQIGERGGREGDGGGEGEGEREGEEASKQPGAENEAARLIPSGCSRSLRPLHTPLHLLFLSFSLIFFFIGGTVTDCTRIGGGIRKKRMLDPTRPSSPSFDRYDVYHAAQVEVRHGVRNRELRALVRSAGATNPPATTKPVTSNATPSLSPSQIPPLRALQAAWMIPQWSLSTINTSCNTWPGVGCTAVTAASAAAAETRSSRSANSSSVVVPAASSTVLVVTSLSVKSLDNVTFPPEISGLAHLSSLVVTNSTFSEFLPSELGSLSSLRRIMLISSSWPAGPDSLAADSLSPPRFEDFLWLTGLSSSLEALSLAGAGLGGAPEAYLTLLTSLTYLNLDNNQLELPFWASFLKNLRVLSLRQAGMYGQIPTELSLCPNLLSLDLSGNSIFGSVPSELFTLSKLQELQLGENALSGSIHSSVSLLASLTHFAIPDNSLSGTLPSGLFSLPSLRNIELNSNDLQSPLPTNFGDASSLTSLVLSSNQLSGAIPPSLGGATALQTLALQYNDFTGIIPSSFTALKSLNVLDVVYNLLTGGLESVADLTNLEVLAIGYNRLGGSFPDELTSLKRLTFLSLEGNSIKGPFPSQIFTLTRLSQVYLYNNEFSGPLPDTIRLWPGPVMILRDNDFSGPLPSSLGLLTGLAMLSLSGNRLSGTVPTTIFVNMTGLAALTLSENEFSGSFPDLSALKKLEWLDMSGNEFSGLLPADSLSSLPQLHYLFVSNNPGLSPDIPPAISRLQSLRLLELVNNSFSGSIPEDLFALRNLKTLLLGGNRLSGVLTSSICSLSALQMLILSSNYLYGQLPECLFYAIPKLGYLDLGHNFFYGQVRDFVSMSATSGGLNLANNYFSGSPTLYANGTKFCPGNNSVVEGQVQTFRVPSAAGWSFDYGGYPIGRSLAENCFDVNANAVCQPGALYPNQRNATDCASFCTSGSCGGNGICQPVDPSDPANFTCACAASYTAVTLPNGTLTCELAIPPAPEATGGGMSIGAIAGIVAGSVLALALLLLGLFLLLRPQVHRWWSDLDVCQAYSLSQIEKATGNWDEGNKLGEGAFSVVYRATPPGGKAETWAVKRAKLMTYDFKAEVRAMASLHHPRLVRLLGFCQDYNQGTGHQEQIFVYELMAEGDLRRHLRHDDCPPLSFLQRLDVVAGVAEGCAYLHGFQPPIVHRDIKPANILLDSNLQAKLADFGLVKEVESEGESSQIVGTPGYLDPEYSSSKLLTTRTDVYSLGVVVLELITGRRVLIDGGSDHIVQWARPFFEAANAQALRDPVMIAPDDAILEFALVGFDCVRCPAMFRPEMKDVALRVRAIKAKYSGMIGRTAEGGSRREEGASADESEGLVDAVSARQVQVSRLAVVSAAAFGTSGSSGISSASSRGRSGTSDASGRGGSRIGGDSSDGF